nr:MAG TPA: hypothetical protein [Caudoviricetes sp.]
MPDYHSSRTPLLDGQQPKPGIWIFALCGTQPTDVYHARHEEVRVSGTVRAEWRVRGVISIYQK